MDKKTRNLIIAVLVVLVIVALAWWYWFEKDTVKFAITAVTPVSGPAGGTALTLTGSTKSKSSPSTWGGRAIKISTKSLGTLRSTVASASLANGAGTITTAPITFPAAFAYAASPADYARVYLKI
jgi:hypothetical protein